MAVQVGIETWEAILDILDDYNELDFIKSNSRRIKEGPAIEHALVWEEVEQEWGNI